MYSFSISLRTVSSIGIISLLLTGCIGASVSSNVVVEDDRPTYSERTAIAADRISAMEDLHAIEGQTLLSEIPTSGVGVYSGLLGMRVTRPDVEDIELVGDMTATADFSNVTISGEVTNFQLETDTYIPGELAMTSESFFSNDGLFRVNLNFTGELTLDEETLTYAAEGDADLTGRDRDYFAGEAVGVFEEGGSQIGEGTIDFALERDD